MYLSPFSGSVREKDIQALALSLQNQIAGRLKDIPVRGELGNKLERMRGKSKPKDRRLEDKPMKLRAKYFILSILSLALLVGVLPMGGFSQNRSNEDWRYRRGTQVNNRYDSEITGTYRLDASRSDNAAATADRAAR